MSTKVTFFPPSHTSPGHEEFLNQGFRFVQVRRVKGTTSVQIGISWTLHTGSSHGPSPQVHTHWSRYTGSPHGPSPQLGTHWSRHIRSSHDPSPQVHTHWLRYTGSSYGPSPQLGTHWSRHTGSSYGPSPPLGTHWSRNTGSSHDPSPLVTHSLVECGDVRFEGTVTPKRDRRWTSRVFPSPDNLHSVITVARGSSPVLRLRFHLPSLDGDTTETPSGRVSAVRPDLPLGVRVPRGRGPGRVRTGSVFVGSLVP